MSAGYFGFYGHAGFVSGLRAAGLEPSAYAGTSAGGLVSALAAAGTATADIERLVLELTREKFWDPDPLGALRGAVGHGFTGLLRGERFRSLLEAALPVRRFEDCPHPLLLAAADLTHGRSRVFTRGELVPRIHATCAYPGLFRAVSLDGALLWDGGLVDKAPLAALHKSAAGKGLDAYLVHYLPSRLRAGGVSGPLAFAQGMDAALVAGRREHFALQLGLLESRGIPVHVVVSHLTEVSPSRMANGRTALEEARRAVTQALERPPVPFEEG